MGLLSELNTVQWVLIGVPLISLWVLLIATMESNGKRQPLAGFIFGPLLIPLLLLMSPFLLVAIVKEGIARRKLQQVVVAIIVLLVVSGYIATVVVLGDPPPPLPADLPVER
jgi:hypothetical protein